MRVKMAFGRNGKEIELPDRNVLAVLNMPEVPPLGDAGQAVAEALRKPIDSPPLVDVARGHRDAVVVVCDITRPAPNRIMLPPILDTLQQAGLDREDITILVATGLHRPNEGAELVEMLGERIVR